MKHTSTRPRWRNVLDQMQDYEACLVRRTTDRNLVHRNWDLVHVDGSLCFVWGLGSRMKKELNPTIVRALLRNTPEAERVEVGKWELVRVPETDPRLLEPCLTIEERNSWEGCVYTHYVPRRLEAACEELERLVPMAGEYHGRLRVGGPTGWSLRSDTPYARAVAMEEWGRGYGGLHEEADLRALRRANSVEKAQEMLWKGNWARP